jgi:signal transduction histidine kinase/ActR/RegA family two-component response regulator
MSWSVYSITLLAFGVMLLVFPFFRSNEPGLWRHRAAWFVLVAVSAWAVGHALEVAATALSGKIFWNNIQWMGAICLPGAYLLFVAEYVSRRRRGSHGWLGLHLLFCGAVGFALWTNEGHHWFWRGLHLSQHTVLTDIREEPGPAAWLLVAYGVAVQMVVAWRLLRWMRDSWPSNRRQGMALVAFSIAAVLAILSDLESWLPDLVPQLSAWVLVGSCLLAGRFLFQWRRDDMVAAARHQMLDSMPEGFMVLDGNNRIVDCNGAAAQFTGPAVADVLGQPLEAVWQFPIMADCVVPFGSSEERPRYLEVSVSPITDSTGQVMGRNVVMRECTKRMRQEDELRQAAKMEAIGRLAGGVAHDFNNLLTAIVGHAELARFNRSKTRKFESHMEQVFQAAEAARNVNQQLLLFCRRAAPEPALIDLSRVAGELQAMLVPLVRDDIELEFLLAQGLPRAKLDRGQLEQVLVNLVVNAQDAMPDGGKLTVVTREVHLPEMCATSGGTIAAGNYLSLFVVDTGNGIAPEVCRRIFEPFFSTKGPGAGTGLGLSVVHGIVRQAGGHICVRTVMGQGSEFEVLFPPSSTSCRSLSERPEWVGSDRVADSTARPPGVPAQRTVQAQPDQAAQTAMALHPGPAPGADLHSSPRTPGVLVVDDEPFVRELVGSMLHHAGFKVFAAANGREALESWPGWADEVDLLLTDVVMPKLNGWELAQQIVAMKPDVKVIVMTGYDAQLVPPDELTDQGYHLLAKPFSLGALLSVFQEILGGVLSEPPPAGGHLRVGRGAWPRGAKPLVRPELKAG